MTKDRQKSEVIGIDSSYRTKKLVLLALITAMAYVVVFVFRMPIIPSVSFLSLELKSAIILIGSFIFGPMSGFIMALVTSLLEMITISSTGVVGCIMNILATSCFVCPAAFVYKKRKTTLSAATGLVIGTILMTIVMVLWNYIITPIYMGIPREAIVELLLPAFIPFNLLKGAINSAVVMLIYKFVLSVLQKMNLIPTEQDSEKKGISSIIGVIILSLLILLTCVLIILAFNGVF